MKLTKTKKKKLQYYIMVIGAASLVSLLVIFLLIGIVRLLRPEKEEVRETIAAFDYSQFEVPKPEVIEEFLTKNKNSRPGKVLKQVNGIVVHYTANPGTDAEANRNYFESRKDEADKSSNKVSSHYIIGLDGTIIQCIPENEIAYASNNRNDDTISIECCHPGKNGKFTEKTYRSLLELTAYLCDKYEIEKEQVIRHYDVTGKLCPKYYVKHPEAWEAFRKEILAVFEQYRVH